MNGTLAEGGGDTDMDIIHFKVSRIYNNNFRSTTCFILYRDNKTVRKSNQ